MSYSYDSYCGYVNGGSPVGALQLLTAAARLGDTSTLLDLHGL